jgi:hypothetical protein
MELNDIKIKKIEIDIEGAASDAGQMSQPFPIRAPAAVVYGMRPYIENKILCDLGCGGGDLLWLAGRWAKQTIGIEMHEELVNIAKVPRENSNTTPDIRRGNFFDWPVPHADVYYCWVGKASEDEGFMRYVERIARNHSPATLIMGCSWSYILQELGFKKESAEDDSRIPSNLSMMNKFAAGKGEVILVPYKETIPKAYGNIDFTKSASWAAGVAEDYWALSIIELNKG